MLTVITAEAIGTASSPVVIPGLSRMVVEAISATAYTFIGYAIWDLGAIGSLELMDAWADLEQVVVTRAYGRPQVSTSGAMEGNLTPAIVSVEATATVEPPTRYYGAAPQEPEITEVSGTATVAGPVVVCGGALVVVPIIVAAGTSPAPLVSVSGVVQAAGEVTATGTVASPSILPQPVSLVVGEVAGTATTVSPTVAASRTLVVPTITSAADLRDPAAVEGATFQDVPVLLRATGTGAVDSVTATPGAYSIVVDAVVGDGEVLTAGLLVAGAVSLSPGEIAVTGSVETLLILTLPLISDVAGVGTVIAADVVAGAVTVTAPVVSGTGSGEALRIIYGTSVLQEMYADPAVGTGLVIPPTMGYGSAAVCTAEVVTAMASAVTVAVIQGPAILRLSHTIDARGSIAMGTGTAIGFRKTDEWGPVAIQLNCAIEAETRVCVVVE